jgi:hypothetical protein
MSVTKHIGIKEALFDNFIAKLNEVATQNNVFATQTHVQGGAFYAICFARE